MDRESDGDHLDDRDSQHRVRLPGFILDEDVGAGTLLTRIASAAGFRPCGGCEQRSAALDRWLTFTNARRK